MSPTEAVVTAIPGPRSRALAERLARCEAPGVTYLGTDYPVFWERAEGAVVIDVDGNCYLDLTSAFGVAALGHTDPHVVHAVARQAERLIHGMGDVHPTEVRTQLLERLADLAPGALRKTYLATSGAEAVEFALKTALLATRKPRVVAYRGAYHGLSLGALEIAGIDKFRAPFGPLVAERATFLPFPGADVPLDAALHALRTALDRDTDAGAVVLEPIQGRGGVIVPPAGFLAGVRTVCDERALLLILDEIYTGFGRTGTMFACQHERVVPDLLCVGKAIAGGVPLAATIGTAHAMDAWPRSAGEALHTSTFLGNPIACAAALATLDRIVALDLPARVAARGPGLGARLQRLRALPDVNDVRGVGFLWAIELRDAARARDVVVRGLAEGVVLLQSGPAGTSITIAPPLTIDDAQLARGLTLLERAIERSAQP
ncbi:MAG: aspartate aminotransferase family protein [Candidatus Eremiobacteraeota bacterium]|nr:aspartate aminotransferase family protein [Candidatus Eremiobacteraeota bacterium]